MEAISDPSTTVISRPSGFRFLSTIGSMRSETVLEDHAIAMPTAIVDKLTAIGMDRVGSRGGYIAQYSIYKLTDNSGNCCPMSPNAAHNSYLLFVFVIYSTKRLLRLMELFVNQGHFYLTIYLIALRTHKNQNGQ